MKILMFKKNPTCQILTFGDNSFIVQSILHLFLPKQLILVLIWSHLPDKGLTCITFLTYDFYWHFVFDVWFDFLFWYLIFIRLPKKTSITECMPPVDVSQFPLQGSFNPLSLPKCDSTFHFKIIAHDSRLQLEVGPTATLYLPSIHRSTYHRIMYRVLQINPTL